MLVSPATFLDDVNKFAWGLVLLQQLSLPCQVTGECFTIKYDNSITVRALHVLLTFE